MDTRKQVKVLIAQEGTTIKKVAQEMTRLGKKISPDVLSWKLAQDTLRYCEFKLILKILGYKMTIEKEKTT